MLLQEVKNIFDQPVEKAYRRSRVYIPKWHEEFLLGLKELLSNNSYRSDKKTFHSFYKKARGYLVEIKLKIREIMDRLRI